MTQPAGIRKLRNITESPMACSWVEKTHESTRPRLTASEPGA